MTTMTHHRTLAAAFLAMSLLAAACTSEPANETIPPTTAGPAPTTTGTPEAATTTTEPGSVTTSTAQPDTTTTTTSTTQAPGPTTIEIDYRDGVVAGPDDVQVALGTRVIIVVTTDVEEDEVHLHGYDVFADVGESSAAIIEFDANIPGVFEVELEDLGQLLVEIEVS